MTVSKPIRYSRRNLIISLLIAAGVAVAFDAINFGGLEGGDEGYQALCVADYRHSAIAMLSYYIGYLWTSLTGFEILNLRILTSIESLFAVGIACMYLQHKVGKGLLSSFTFFTMMVTIRISQYNFYNWDTGSFLFDSIALVMMLSYIDRPRIWKATVLGAALTCMTMARVPLVVFFIPATICLIAGGRHSHRAGRLIAADTVGMYLMAGIFFIILSSMMIGSPGAYIDSFRPENIIVGHTPDNIGEYMWRLRFYGPQLLAWWWPAIGCVIFPLFLVRMSSAHKAWSAIIVASTAILAIILMHLYTAYTGNTWSCLGWSAPLILAPVLFCPIWNMTHSKSQRIVTPRLQLWLCMLTPLLITLGSDTFFQRMCVEFTIPCVIACIWGIIPATGKKYLHAFLIMTAIVMGSALLAHDMLRVKKNSVPAPSAIPVLNNIYISPTWRNAAEQIAYHADRLRRENKKFMFMGERYTGRLYAGEDRGPSIHYFGLANYPDVLLDSLRQADAVIVLATFPPVVSEEPTLGPLGYKNTYSYDQLLVYEKQ